jgi:hypothetical protein
VRDSKGLKETREKGDDAHSTGERLSPADEDGVLDNVQRMQSHDSSQDSEPTHALRG